MTNDAQNPAQTSETFRITREEVDAQRRAQQARDAAACTRGDLEDYGSGNYARREQARTAELRRRATRLAEDARHRRLSDMRPPDTEDWSESSSESYPGFDHFLERLSKLGEVVPGTPAFMAKAPPPESVIDLIGPQGAEGFGIIKRIHAVGPDIGTELT